MEISSLIGGWAEPVVKTSMVLTSNAPLGHMLLEKVFGWFWDGFGRFLNAKTKVKRKRVDLWECSYVFNGCGVPQKKHK